jgi:hypothetical protein
MYLCVVVLLQRWFYVHENTLEALDDEVLRREAAYAFESIGRVSLNESAWNYLRGLHRLHRTQAGLHETIKAW